MPSNIQNIFKPVSAAMRKHISKRTLNGLYDANVIIGASIALDVYTNGVDYVQIGRNKNIKKTDREYLRAYKLTNGVVEGALQVGAAALLLNEKTQNGLLKISRKLTGMPINPGEAVKRNFRVFSALAGCIILAKRILAPLVVTPLTTYVRKNFDV